MLKIYGQCKCCTTHGCRIKDKVYLCLFILITRAYMFGLYFCKNYRHLLGFFVCQFRKFWAIFILEFIFGQVASSVNPRFSMVKAGREKRVPILCYHLLLRFQPISLKLPLLLFDTDPKPSKNCKPVPIY